MKKKKTASIYTVENNVNNMVYVGKTTQTVSRRWTEHKRDYKKGTTKLYLAMKDIGVSNFSIRTIEKLKGNDKHFNEREIHWISHYDSFNNGYNSTTGGTRGHKMCEEMKDKLSKAFSGEKNPMFGKTHTPEARAIIGETSRNREYTEKDIAKISERMKGEGNPFYGKTHSEKTKQKLRDWNIGRKHSEEAKQKMSKSRSGEKHHNYGKKGKHSTNTTTIYQYDKQWSLIKTFNTMSETLTYLGLKGHSGLYKAVKNKTIYKNYFWSKSPLETIETTSKTDEKGVE